MELRTKAFTLLQGFQKKWRRIRGEKQEFQNLLQGLAYRDGMAIPQLSHHEAAAGSCSIHNIFKFLCQREILESCGRLDLSLDEIAREAALLPRWAHATSRGSKVVTKIVTAFEQTSK